MVGRKKSSNQVLQKKSRESFQFKGSSCSSGELGRVGYKVDEVLPGTSPLLRRSVKNCSENGFLVLCLNSRSLNEFILENS